MKDAFLGCLPRLNCSNDHNVTHQFMQIFSRLTNIELIIPILFAFNSKFFMWSVGCRQVNNIHPGSKRRLAIVTSFTLKEHICNTPVPHKFRQWNPRFHKGGQTIEGLHRVSVPCLFSNFHILFGKVRQKVEMNGRTKLQLNILHAVNA